MSEFNNDLFYMTDRAKINIDVMKFPGGEVGVNVNQPQDPVMCKFRGHIEARIRSSDDLMALLLATDALKRAYPGAEWCLVLPYIPYARQDRVCNAGEALSVRVFADLINAQGYAAVLVYDPHSAVAAACIDRCTVASQYDIFADIHQDWSNITIVAPDQGATKKCEDFAKRVGAKAVITCSKTRELKTGKIIGMSFNDVAKLDNEHLVVLDDICDGGRTFIELANLIHEHTVEDTPRLVELAVTHGIFSKGVDVVAKHYGTIYTTDSYFNQDHEKVVVIQL